MLNKWALAQKSLGGGGGFLPSPTQYETEARFVGIKYYGETFL